ncbi:hypothetical protein BZG36_03404 [Bifiguratus adelaidae]|uniref:DNA polymerase delta subunit 3 n=1 Tax=Bifiguratus adelaidae TaxID=1938954 RepID=A0A261Y0P6_9FUNG|nr:hypothetical protein BZG36_03404 [Bifiguratus adelaidae]
MSETHFEVLDTLVKHEQRIVTYRCLSRKLNIHVNRAKQTLIEYLFANEDSLSAVYQVTGISAQEQTRTISLVQKEELEDVMTKKYQHVDGVYVYSVQPTRLKDLSMLVAADYDMARLSLEDRFRLGMTRNIKAAEPIANRKPSARAAESGVSASKTAPTPNDAEKTPIPGVTPMVQSGPPNKSVGAAKSKPTAANFFKPSTPKKNTSTAPKTTAATTTEAARRKFQVLSGMQSHSEEDVSDEERDRRLAFSSTEAGEQKDLADEEAEELDGDITMEDLDDERIPDFPRAEPDVDENANKSPATPSEEEQVEQAPGRRRLKRKVQKKKTFKNAKGMLVTEYVDEWESYSDDETAPASAPAPKKTPSTPMSPAKSGSRVASKKPGVKQPPGEQKSLMSFWGKR